MHLKRNFFYLHYVNYMAILAMKFTYVVYVENTCITTWGFLHANPGIYVFLIATRPPRTCSISLLLSSISRTFVLYDSQMALFAPRPIFEYIMFRILILWSERSKINSFCRCENSVIFCSLVLHRVQKQELTRVSNFIRFSRMKYSGYRCIR